MKDSIQALIHLQECYAALYALSEQIDCYISRLTDLDYEEVEILSDMQRSVDEKLDEIYHKASKMARRLNLQHSINAHRN